jgi:hypothetical protein
MSVYLGLLCGNLRIFLMHGTLLDKQKANGGFLFSNKRIQPCFNYDNSDVCFDNWENYCVPLDQAVMFSVWFLRWSECSKLLSNCGSYAGVSVSSFSQVVVHQASNKMAAVCFDVQSAAAISTSCSRPWFVLLAVLQLLSFAYENVELPK